jgi:hypothetical protein
MRKLRQKIHRELPRERRCLVCGDHASFGVGVNVSRGIEGIWYCHGHYALTPDGQEMAARNLKGAMSDVDFSE